MKKLEQAIRDLQELTGLPVELRTDQIRDPQEALEKIRTLCRLMQDTGHRETVIRSWLTGQISDDEFFLYCDRVRLDRSQKRGLFLIQLTREIYPEVSMVLHSMFADSRTWIIPFGQTRLLVACPFPAHEQPDMKGIAYQLLDALNTELMEQAVIAYCSAAGQTLQLPALCRQCQLAMEAGLAFYPDKTIYSYEELGIGRLLYDCSKEACRDYIRSNIGDRFLETDPGSPAFDPEYRNTAACFLQNDLNIAQTARQLHLHRNTLLYRLEQIQHETGLDIRHFDQAMTYRICSLILLDLN